MFEPENNPLQSGRDSDWDRLIESIGPASIILIINGRLGSSLSRYLGADDILQEALLRVWRDRANFQWQGLKSFRSWFLTIVDHCISDAADYYGAQKRGGGRPTTPFSVLSRSSGPTTEGSVFAGPIATTTPSRIVSYAEQAAAMQGALNALPPELRDVVGFRLFQQLTMQQIADRLQIGLSATRHRFRKGAAIYQQRLMSEFASRSIHHPRENPALGTADAAS